MRYPQHVALAVVCSASFLASAQEPLDEADFGFFYDSLAPHGAWINLQGYGPCWRPDVDEDWAPYTRGYWAFTQQGWTWVSHEPFGGIVFHYGRWLITKSGWCWVPGSEWAPAWVSWRAGEQYVGWAPLPPEAQWRPDRGIGNWIDVHTEIGPSYYRFCSIRDFCSPRLSEVVVRPSRNVTILLRTENVTNIVVHRNEVYCGGPRYDWVSERVGVEVPVLRLAREENHRHYRSATGAGGQNVVIQNILVVPSPGRVNLGGASSMVQAPTTNVPVSRGWATSQAANQQLKAYYQSEWSSRRPQAASDFSPERHAGQAFQGLSTPSATERRAALSTWTANPQPAVQPPAPQPVAPQMPAVQLPASQPSSSTRARQIEAPGISSPVAPQGVPSAPIGVFGGSPERQTPPPIRSSGPAGNSFFVAPAAPPKSVSGGSSVQPQMRAGTEPLGVNGAPGIGTTPQARPSQSSRTSYSTPEPAGSSPNFGSQGGAVRPMTTQPATPSGQVPSAFPSNPPRTVQPPTPAATPQGSPRPGFGAPMGRGSEVAPSVSNGRPPSSGASLNSPSAPAAAAGTPNIGAPSQQKKKPGEPGYVPQ